MNDKGLVCFPGPGHMESKSSDLPLPIGMFVIIVESRLSDGHHQRALGHLHKIFWQALGDRSRIMGMNPHDSEEAPSGIAFTQCKGLAARGQVRSDNREPADPGLLCPAKDLFDLAVEKLPVQMTVRIDKSKHVNPLRFSCSQEHLKGSGFSRSP